MQLVIDIDEYDYEKAKELVSEGLFDYEGTTAHLFKSVANGISLSQADSVVKGLLKMKNDFDAMAYFIADNKNYSLDELLSELENQTEVGQKFRDDVNEIILAYLMKFTGEE